MRKSLAWRSIVNDGRLVQQLTQAQVKDAGEKETSHDDAGVKAVRTAWSHILYPVKSETAGKSFDLGHDPITSRERAALPGVVYDKVKADQISITARSLIEFVSIPKGDETSRRKHPMKGRAAPLRPRGTASG